jgi:hypothetical protein
MKQSDVRRKIKGLNTKIEKAYQEIKAIQSVCPHADLTYKYDGDSGNYDKSLDFYWIDWCCHDCGKRWTTDQENAYHLTEVVYPHAKEIKKNR